MFAAALTLLLVAASGAARATTPVVLPPGEVAATWAEPLNLADLRVGAAGSGTWVELVDRGETWAVRVRSTSGRLDEALVPEPRTAAEREDVAWLARSLLAPPSAVSSWDDVAALQAESVARASNVGAVTSAPATATAAPTKGAAPTTAAVTTNTAPTAASASTATPASKGAAAPTTAAPPKATAQTTTSVTTTTKTAKSTAASTSTPTSTTTTKAPASATTVPSAPPNAATPATPNAAPTTASATPPTVAAKPAPATTKAPTAKASRTPVATPTAVTSTPPAVAAPTAPASAPPSSTVASAPPTTASSSPAAISTDSERRSATVTGPRPYAHADGGVGWRPDATLAPRVGIDAGVRIPLASLEVTVGAGAAWTPRRALAVGEGSEQVEAVDATARLGLRVPVALSPTIAVFGGASVRSYLADGTPVVTAPVPVAGLAVSVRAPLLVGFALVPSVGVQTDLRPVSVAIGAESAGALSPVELNAGVGLEWSQKN